MIWKNNEEYKKIQKENIDNTQPIIMDLFNKYKSIVIVVGIMIIMLIGISLISKSNDSDIKEPDVGQPNIEQPTTGNQNYLTLNGDEFVTIYRGTDYVEPGYKAYNSKNEDLSQFVAIDSTLDIETIGTYEIKYKLYDIIVTRKIEVIANPNEKVEIVLKPSEVGKEDTDVYLLKGEKYIEPGYEVISSFEEEIGEVEVIGTVDTEKVGTYEIIYTINDPNGATFSVKRNVIVTDIRITLTKSTEEYTKENVTIRVQVEDEYFDYFELPNKNKVYGQTYSYTVSENGTYTFTAYSKKGFKKTSSIEIKNIDKEAPKGSCSGSYKDGVSTIDIAATDNVKIKNYKINNKTYTTKKITINEELEKVTVKVSDMAGNTKNISCTLKDKNEFITSDASITFSYKYVSENTPLPYALYTPSTASKVRPTPLILWLHGSGEVGKTESDLKNSGLLAALDKWEEKKLDGFNAYVLCPHLAKGSGLSYWYDKRGKTDALDRINELLEKIIKEYNIDQNKIVISGHSMGAVGTEYITYKKPKYFSAMVELSGYNYGGGSQYDYTIVGIKETGIAVRGFYGANDYEDPRIYMSGLFKNTFGLVTMIDREYASHGLVPFGAFTKDDDPKDNKSDLIEWMLSQTRNY